MYEKCYKMFKKLIVLNSCLDTLAEKSVFSRTTVVVLMIMSGSDEVKVWKREDCLVQTLTT